MFLAVVANRYAKEGSDVGFKERLPVTQRPRMLRSLRRQMLARDVEQAQMNMSQPHAK